MKTTKYLLLILGLIGTAAAVYALFTSDEIGTNLIFLVCGVSLIYGYFALHRKPWEEE